MVTIPLTRPFQAALVAAPDYIKARGTPLAVADLGGHNLIGFRMLGSGALYEWELKDNGADVSVSTKGSVIVTDSTYARDLALAGVGIAYLYEPLVRSDLRDGRLVWLLRECSVQEDGLFLYFPQRAQLAPKLRAFIDTSKEIGPT
jgi:DNA-binding transcriptional LysR family regulator